MNDLQPELMYPEEVQEVLQAVREMGDTAEYFPKKTVIKIRGNGSFDVSQANRLLAALKNLPEGISIDVDSPGTRREKLKELSRSYYENHTKPKSGPKFTPKKKKRKK